MIFITVPISGFYKERCVGSVNRMQYARLVSILFYDPRDEPKCLPITPHRGDLLTQASR